jgi:hypothetical protein
MHRLNPLIKVSHSSLPWALGFTCATRPRRLSPRGKIVFLWESYLRHSVKENRSCLQFERQFSRQVKNVSYQLIGAKDGASVIAIT